MKGGFLKVWGESYSFYNLEGSFFFVERICGLVLFLLRSRVGF